jgi:hypothetical protein
MIDQRLPPPLMTSEPGSFARATIVERKPQIIQQVIDDNGYPPEIVARLAAFRQEIAESSIQPLAGPAPDAQFWNEEVAAYQGRTWLELPWYLAETYFYRRLLEAVGYLQPGIWHGRDPFAMQKRGQERAALPGLREIWAQLAAVAPPARFVALLHSCLWGNRADLSNLTVREQARGGLSTRLEQHNILINHTTQVAGLLAQGVERLDIVADNAGWELLSDLALADFLLGEGWVETMVFHLKDRPFFVSDAMPQDLRETLSLLGEEALGQRLSSYLASGRLALEDDPFWTGPLMFRQMPPALATDLARADLVILKGDVNYRRLLDDCHWPHTARMEDIASYFPASFLTLRTLKGEIMIGLEPGQAAALGGQDPTWLINGKRGIVQLVTKPQSARNAQAIPQNSALAH